MGGVAFSIVTLSWDLRQPCALGGAEFQGGQPDCGLTGLDAVPTRWVVGAHGPAATAAGDMGDPGFSCQVRTRGPHPGGLASGQGLPSSVPKPVFALAQDL